MEFRCQKYHRFISGYVLINPPTIRMYSSTNISARLSQIFILSLSLPSFQRNNVIPFASYSFLTGFQREIDFIRDIIKNDAHSRFSLRDRLKAIERPFTIFCLFASFRRYIEFCTTEKMEEMEHGSLLSHDYLNSSNGSEKSLLLVLARRDPRFYNCTVCNNFEKIQCNGAKRGRGSRQLS